MRARLGPAVAAILVVLAAGCGDDGEPVQDEGAQAPAPGSSGSSGEGGRKACLVVTGSGINDGGFNQSAWEGVQAGAEASGLEAQYVQADQEADYLSATEAFTKQPCRIIVTTSFAMTDATKTVAERTPNKDFAIVDVSYDPPIPNVRGLVFDSGQAAFLGGYLAAGMSESGVVATYGGVKIPPVTLFMDGYVDGVEHYNQEHDADVRVLGWSKDEQEGTFVGNFTDQAKGAQIARGFMDQGADVIFGLGSLPDLGAAAAIQDSGGGNVKMIWPNTDGCEERPAICDILLTSVLKNVAVATQGVVEEAAAGEFESGTYVGTLENEGVGLAPFHEFEDDVPPELAQEVEEVTQQIIDGEIEVRSEATPSGA
ncbi:MAG: BMP family lipoprotein [Thermoleophilaceae bacterium]